MKYNKYLVLFIIIGISVPDNVGAQSAQDQLARLRNLGKAFYENSATQYEAVGQFKQALDLAPDSARERINYGLSLMRAGQVPAGVAELEQAQKQSPSIPHTWFNLGIAYKRDARYSEAIAQFERMVELVPGDAISHYNLAVLYKLEKQPERAIEHFQRSAALDPNLAGPRFQLATTYRQAKKLDDSKREMSAFRRIKKEQANAAVPEDLEWSFFSEIYETIDSAVVRDTGPTARIDFAAIPVDVGTHAATAGLAVLDARGNGQPDLMAWSRDGVRFLAGGNTPESVGLDGVKNVISVVTGDIDNDGLMDLCVITDAGASLYSNLGDGTFGPHTATIAGGTFRNAVWLDYDHDYDIDLFLLGRQSMLMRNNGKAGFSDESASFPFVTGDATGGTRIDLVADTQGMDLAVVYGDRPGVLYRDRLAGKYEAIPLAELVAGSTTIQAKDIDNDGWTDLAATSGSGAVALINDQRDGFRRVQVVTGSVVSLTIVDIENRTASELIAAGKIYRNLGGGSFDRGSDLMSSTIASVAADFNSDGRMDLGVIGNDGAIALWRNETQSTNRWIRVGIDGVKNLKLAPGAEIEVKSGIRYQKKIYQGSALHFGLATYDEVDAIRITWPNGLIQNETKQAAGQTVQYPEAQRLSGSCPMIFTWNGSRFEFITDVLGVAPLGASAGDGQYFPVDHDEYIQIAGESLVPHDDGTYEIRITEELREVAYLDEIRLVSVDHPATIDVFTNDKFKAPPFPEFRLFGVSERSYPVSAVDHTGRNVLDKLTRLDRTYPDNFIRDYAGVAETQYITLDFGKNAPAGNAILVMNGWVDWADGSTFLGASQESDQGLVLPYLQVRDQSGNWKTVIEDMGIPAGKPKTIVVDLTNRFLSEDRQVRIVTNLCVYWDEIFMGTDTLSSQAQGGEPAIRMTDLRAASAALRHNGFSEVVIHPERKQPERFIYGEPRPVSMWNPTPGRYTRYGDVRELTDTIDDRYIIMGSGDEIRLTFDSSELPVLPEGSKRDFLLFVDGWAKDGDANTAFSQTVEPLPYHAMPQYPYAGDHAFPEDGVHNLYREFYNTRPALRLIRPLNEEADRALAISRATEN